MKSIERSFFFLNRKVRWGLTIWGWFLIIFIFLFIFFILGLNLFRFLAPVQREKSDILVLEGSVPDYVIDSAIREFKKGNYKLLITTGTPVEWGYLFSDYKNTSQIAAASLTKSGFDSSKLVVLSTPEIRNDRTYNSAKELNRWLKKNKPGVTSINLMTMGVHGGRSRMLFQYALGDSVRVGVISVKNFYYGPDDWWRSSKGFRETVNEALGYFYVRLFFRPY